LESLEAIMSGIFLRQQTLLAQRLWIPRLR